jgi:hypothetical protein
MKSNVDIRDMIRSADEFFIISFNNKTFIPNFVNMAFACEIYLKSILQHNVGSFPKEHNLETLYDAAIKHIDEKEFLIALNKEVEKDFPYYGVNNTERDLREMFKKHKNLFEDWRYIFEGKVQKPYVADMMLANFTSALKKYVHKFIVKEENK